MTARRVPKVKNEDGVDGTPANAITKALLSAVENDDSEISCKALLNVFQSSSPSKSQILETIQFFPKSSAKRFFSGLKAILESIISEEAYVPDSAFEEENEDQEDDEEITPDEKSTECLHFLKYAALSVKAHVEGRLEQKKNQAKSQDERRQSVLMKQQLPILPQVHEVAFDLHNILLSLHSCGPESLGTLQAILSLCESWWFANAAHRDTLIAQCLPILVIQALDGKEFLKSHIQKLYKLRDAFHVIDFDNPSSDSLRQLLLRVASNPLCLKISEGKKFLASLFQDRDLVVDLHLAFRAQMPEAKSSVLQAYGEIYHRAWKHAAEAEESVQLEEEESVRDYLEHQTLQDLMHAVIHVASPTTHKSILTLLEPIHADKKSPEVASLLYRLYSPILWRSLAAANPIVRKNSIVVLEKVFPLQDGEVKVAVEKATGALKNALEDVDPRVRVAGSEATARICAMFWDALPSADIRMLLNHIVMEHSSDAASSAVRAAALEATITLLDAPQSHAVLRALLPSLGNLIHDKAERVRIAAVKMLNRIKQIKGIRFYHVVPVDHLTARLSEERRLHCSPRNAVAKELTALLLNSYFPSSSVNSQLQRTLAFLMTDPNAALVFYANLADHLEVESVVKFIVMLLACLKSAVQVDQAQEVKEYSKKGNKKRRRKGAPPPDQDDDEDSSEENNENNLSASNTPLMASLTETIQILWESIESQLSDPRYEACNALILNRFTKEVNLVHILSHFEQKAVDNDTKSRVECQRVCAAILCCASRLPKKAVKGIVSFVSSSLHSLAQEDRRPCPNVASHLALLCVCGMTEEVASTLAASIESAFGDDITLMSPVFDEGRRRSRRVSSGSGKAQSSVLPKFPLKMAWEILDNTLQGSNPSSVAVREAILSSPAAYSSMESALERGTLFAERLLAADSVIGRGFKETEVEFILCSCEAYGRFALHNEAHNQNDGDLGFNRQTKTLLDWTTEKVIPALLGAQSGETELLDLDLSRISNVSDSLIMPGSPSPLSPPKQKANLGRTPDRPSAFDMDQTLSHDPAVFLVTSVARSLLQSSCVVFAELLAVGSSCGDDIESSAVGWCSIFDGDEEMEEDENGEKQHIRAELLPSFIRLAIQLCKSSNKNCALLRALFVKCNLGRGMEQERNLMKKAVSALLSTRSNGAMLTEKLVETFFNAASELNDDVNTDSSMVSLDEDTSSVDMVLSHSKGCLATVLEALASNSNARRSLARKLVSRLQGETNITKANFDARCLLWLVENHNNAALTSIVSELEAERFEEGGEMRGVVHRLLESA